MATRLVGVDSEDGVLPDLVQTALAAQIADDESTIGAAIASVVGDASGAVDSVNAQTGAVVLGAADVGAATSAQGALADSAVQPGDTGTTYWHVYSSAGETRVGAAAVEVWIPDTPSLADPTNAAEGDIVQRWESIELLSYALSDETTELSTGEARLTVRAPFAFTLVDVRASLAAASSSGAVTVDINEAGTTVLATKLTIDASEKTSTTAATAAVISDGTVADDAEITFDIDGAGTDAAGLKVTLYVVRT